MDEKILKILIIVIVVLLCGAILHFFLAGEGVKQSLQQEVTNNKTGETSRENTGIIIVLQLMRIYMDEHRGIEPPEYCWDDFAGCVELTAPNERMKQVCRNAVITIQESTQKAMAENSVILGFNKTMFNLQVDSACPLQEEMSDIAAEEPLFPDTEAQSNCLSEKGMDFYGMVKSAEELNKCIDEINEYYGE